MSIIPIIMALGKTPSFYFKKLQFVKWKQFENIDIDFHEKLTIITSANGGGKTTLLNFLAQHFGWSFEELSTPVINPITQVYQWIISFFKSEEVELTNSIGELIYSNNQKANITFKNGNSPKYQLIITPRLTVRGLNITANRTLFQYEQISDISLGKVSKQQAFNVSTNSNKNNFFHTVGNNRAISYIIKETLLNWTLSNHTVPLNPADIEAKNNFFGFQEVLKKILPLTLGFKELSIRNMEIVLITDSGEFMLDAVSGGISAIIEIAWLIFTFPQKSNEKLVVLIDEIENHLHPSMQRSILPNLTNTFPNIQFIVTTHSPLVVGSVKDSYVYALRYNQNNKVFSEQLDLVGKAKTSTEILNEVLGIPFTLPIWVESTLNEIILRYSELGINAENVSLMRNELKEIGLENLMPLAIQNLFSK